MRLGLHKYKVASVREPYRPVCLLFAGEAEGGATLAQNIKGLIRAEILDALNGMLTIGRRAPRQALVVLNITAQLILIQLF